MKPQMNAKEYDLIKDKKRANQDWIIFIMI